MVFNLCLSVFPYDISKTDVAKITKLHTKIFHNESWKPIYFGVKWSKVKVTTTMPPCIFALLWVLASSLVITISIHIEHIWSHCNQYNRIISIRNKLKLQRLCQNINRGKCKFIRITTSSVEQQRSLRQIKNYCQVSHCMPVLLQHTSHHSAIQQYQIQQHKKTEKYHSK